MSILTKYGIAPPNKPPNGPPSITSPGTPPPPPPNDEKVNIIRIIRASFDIRNSINDTEHSDIVMRGKINSVIKPGGIIDNLPISSLKYVKLKNYAKEALVELKNGFYYIKTKSLLDYIISDEFRK